MGHSSIRGVGDLAKNHVKHVNTWSDEELNNHIHEQYELYRHRSKFIWKLDLDIITSAGFELLLKNQ